jgi:N-acetylglucosaminyl-diphospho-decaprenol L-rhamnosyltransferase
VTQPDLSIVIVSWNTRALLEACLASLHATSEERSSILNMESEIIVVDNASTDGSPDMVRARFPAVRLIECDHNLGFAAGNNRGLSVASGRYALLLNSDTEVRPGALACLLAFMDAYPRAGACGPRLLNSDGTLQPSCSPMLTPGREFWRLMFLDAVWPRATYPMRDADVCQPRQVETIKGACLMLRRAALDQAGLLDEGYFMYTEEVDLCYRLAQDGWELWWTPAAEVVHYGEASTRQQREDMYIQLYCSKTRFYRKFGGEANAVRFQRLLRIAYTPRWVAARLASLLRPELRPRARTYARLLRELHTF